MRHSSLFCLFTAFLAASPVVAGSGCMDRLENLTAPSLPKTTSALHAIAKGPCAVDVIFSLSAEGAVTVIGSSSSESRCKVLEDFAKKAVQSSTFRSGDDIDNCTIRLAFETDEEAVVALPGPPAAATDRNEA